MPGVLNALFDEKKLDPALKASIQRCRVPKNKLTLDKEIGKGFFGAVYKGQLITASGDLKSVAVKSIKGK